ncbi:class I SAM-dependent methyltransferase [bacterium]
MNILCPVCNSSKGVPFYSGDKHENYRQYYYCSNCSFVFIDKKYFLSKQEEKNRYLKHNNRMDDEKYRTFLEQIYTALAPYIKTGANGLDYGSGQCLLLSRIFTEHGFKMEGYDPLFHNDKNVLKRKYDFIVSTETVEHFYNPQKEFERLKSLIKTPGYIGIMTCMLESWDEFPSWYYHKDTTHVSFYTKNTFKYIANQYNFNCIFPRKNIIILEI